MDGPSHRVVASYLSSDIGTTAAREWRDPAAAPGNKTAKLRAVRIRTTDGTITDAIDIRRPVGVEMEFEVCESGWTLTPVFDFYNEEGLLLFGALDSDPEWRGRPRECGTYTVTAWVPGNLLTEGTVIVDAELLTTHPAVQHFYERQAVAFHVVDSMEGDSARGDWGGSMPGVMRPMLRWSTRVAPEIGESRARVGGQADVS
jgi:lipopolysaccharide transport system ATP-binding protein